MIRRGMHLSRRSVRLLAVTAILAGCGGSGKSRPETATAAPGPKTPASVEEAGKRLLEQYKQGYQVRSMEALTPLYSATEDLVLTYQGRSIKGWEAVRVYLTQRMFQLSEVRFEVDDVRVSTLGKGGAVVTASMARTLGTLATSVREKGVLILVLRRQGDGWVIVNEHFSFTPNAM